VAYDSTTYRGAAPHYRAGRPPYSPQLEAVLTDELGLDGTGRMLDVGCGPGVLAVGLADLFADVVAVGPDDDMLADARKAAAEAGVTNIGWFRHWPGIYRARPLARTGSSPSASRSTGPTGNELPRPTTRCWNPAAPWRSSCTPSRASPDPPAPGPPPIPHDEISALVAKYLGSTRRAGQGTTPERTHRFEDMLARTRFGAPRVLFAPGKS
jgi:hypothetical protein